VVSGQTCLSLCNRAVLVGAVQRCLQEIAHQQSAPTDQKVEDLEANANVGGKLAQLGRRIIDGFAKKMADQFFERFQQTIEGPAEVDTMTNDGEEAPKKGWLGRMFGKESKGGQE
jgi:hypothetical protein